MASRKKAPSFEYYENPLNSIGYLLRIAFRSFSRALERRTLPAGVTSGQWRFLRVLWAEDGLTQIELSRRVGMREPTTVAAVNGLERAGYVVRRKSATDRRKVHVHLTARAKRLKAKLIPFVAEVNALGLKGLSAQNATVLRKSLLKIIDNFSHDDGDSYQDAKFRSRVSDFEG
ncbi:MAG TPA: MarR family winged helix-turn-helix transcriptional regulator [Rhizomicrobium sp.]|jgi:DNA-binding MarR family transcriptional regulator|nr:MarR family winged helix-turn-helix transcriptional regulator [Rhizomicrobium sp.]